VSVLSPIDAAAVVDGFFQRAGIRPLLSLDEFWAVALKNYGNEAQQLKECLDHGGDRAIAIAHQLMNSSLDFANLALSQFEARKLRAAAVWLLQGRISAEGKVLELGCDSGLLLCLLASYYPETHFTGLDKGKESIQIAQERAAKLGLRNVNFKAGNVARGFAGTAGSGYRMVLSVTVFHDVLAERPMSAPGATKPEGPAPFPVCSANRRVRLIEAAPGRQAAKECLHEQRV
jgi:SAM-dependent methyltransferase